MQAANWSPSTPDEREYYDKLFQIAGASNMGRLTGQPAVNFLARSGLPFDTLKQVRVLYVYLFPLLPSII